MLRRARNMSVFTDLSTSSSLGFDYELMWKCRMLAGANTVSQKKSKLHQYAVV